MADQSLTPTEHVVLYRWGFVLLAVFCATALTSYLYFSQQEYETVQSIYTATHTPVVIRPNPYTSLTLQAESVYVYDVADGTVLYQHNAERPVALASITKVMTALVVSEALASTTVFTLPYNLTSPNNAGTLRAGEVWRVKDLLTFMLVTSSNDTAQYLADRVDAHTSPNPGSTTTPTTVERMNTLADTLGLTSLEFSNPSGLDESASRAGAYGSARDIAHLLIYAASTSPSLFSYTGQETVTLSPVRGAQLVVSNTDHVLDAIPNVLMGKTGLTDLAGGNLAILFDPGLGHPIAIVVLGSTEHGRFDDMKKLVDATIREVQ